MKAKVLMLIAAVFFASAARINAAYAACGTPGCSMAAEETIVEGEVINDFCPMSGKKISEDTSYRMKCGDKAIGFCGSGCLKAFKADFEKCIGETDKQQS